MKRPARITAITAFKPRRISPLVRARRQIGRKLAGAKKEIAAQLHSATEIQGRIRELIKLAKEQGYLTFEDLNEALPEAITDADELDAILTRLRRMEIDIIEASEVDRYKDEKKDAE